MTEEFIKPIVVISKCLEFEAVRWDGQIIPDAFVHKLTPFVDFIPVCPEVEIGLRVPRKPVRVVLVDGKRRLIQSEIGIDITEKMVQFAESFLNSIKEVDGFLLKNRSPSSGIKDVKIYPGMGKVASIGKGAGFFGGTVVDKFTPLAIEDEGRLTNFNIRETFLTKIFAHARLREVLKSGTMRELIDFQARNKYLLMAYNQSELRILGRIVANPEKRKWRETATDYEKHFNLALAKMARRTSIINVLMHVLGYFSQSLSAKEKVYFLDILDKYRKESLPLSALQAVLRSWITKYEIEYLENQTFFNPYPESLVDLRNSGKEYRK
jgi:uncharacterized protein YbgA (DUF1722 family)/uncharacterized protein YbbK (DUF523 family)